MKYNRSPTSLDGRLAHFFYSNQIQDNYSITIKIGQIQNVNKPFFPLQKPHFNHAMFERTSNNEYLFYVFVFTTLKQENPADT